MLKAITTGLSALLLGVLVTTASVNAATTKPTAEAAKVAYCTVKMDAASNTDQSLKESGLGNRRQYQPAHDHWTHGVHHGYHHIFKYKYTTVKTEKTEMFAHHHHGWWGHWGHYRHHGEGAYGGHGGRGYRGCYDCDWHHHTHEHTVKHIDVKTTVKVTDKGHSTHECPHGCALDGFSEGNGHAGYVEVKVNDKLDGGAANLKGLPQASFDKVNK